MCHFSEPLFFISLFLSSFFLFFYSFSLFSFLLSFSFILSFPLIFHFHFFIFSCIIFFFFFYFYFYSFSLYFFSFLSPSLSISFLFTHLLVNFSFSLVPKFSFISLCLPFFFFPSFTSPQCSFSPQPPPPNAVQLSCFWKFQEVNINAATDATATTLVAMTTLTFLVILLRDNLSP
ncbi:unnamed protein product [Acanthosepion pharaonis]|uniref:Uncharacterized protein n=1 Tax=Acanthosepion pharaonis TaxID=158019 RepID=A0A812E074_ACAPH|nr:unnamed protein product [Sepia pharaonis]